MHSWCYCSVDIVGTRRNCNKPAVAEIIKHWPISVCQFHAEVAEKNGFDVRWYEDWEVDFVETETGGLE